MKTNRPALSGQANRSEQIVLPGDYAMVAGEAVATPWGWYWGDEASPDETACPNYDLRRGWVASLESPQATEDIAGLEHLDNYDLKIEAARLGIDTYDLADDGWDVSVVIMRRRDAVRLARNLAG